MCSALFHQYAPRFESSLVGDLGYRGPALLFKAVLSVRARAASRLSSSAASISDAAPGSLLGLREGVDHFVGVDLSPRMIEKSRPTGLYAELEVADMCRACAEGWTRAPI